MSIETVANGVHVIPLGSVNAVVLDDDNGPVLVDTGMPKDANKIIDGLKELNYAPDEVQKIIVTHHHPDHAGGLAELKRVTGAPATMHRTDAEAVRKGVSVRSLKRTPGLLSLILSIIVGLTSKDITPAEIEEEVNEGDLLEIAGGMEVLHTPGHSAGHISLLLPRDGGILIAGDVAVNVMGLRVPAVVEDLSVVLESLKRVSRLQFDTAVFMHGKPITGNACQLFADKWG